MKVTPNELRELRIKCGLVQKQVADAMGVSINHYSLIERGQRYGRKGFNEDAAAWIKKQRKSK